MKNGKKREKVKVSSTGGKNVKKNENSKDFTPEIDSFASLLHINI